IETGFLNQAGVAALLDGFAGTGALLEQLEIVLDVGTARILGLRGAQDRAGARIIAAQHVGIALVIEDLRRRSDDLDRLVVGAVGELEPAQPIVAGREPDPGFGIARMQLDGTTEVALGDPEIAGAEVLLAEVEIVIRIAAEQPAAARGASLGRRERPGWIVRRGRRSERAGRLAARAGAEQVAQFGRGLAAAKQCKARHRSDKDATWTQLHRRAPTHHAVVFSPPKRTRARRGGG